MWLSGEGYIVSPGEWAGVRKQELSLCLRWLQFPKVRTCPGRPLLSGHCHPEVQLVMWAHIPLPGNSQKGKTRSFGAITIAGEISDNQTVCDPPSPGMCPPHRPSQRVLQPRSTITAQDIEHMAAVDSSVDPIKYQAVLLASKSKDLRFYFLICGKGNTAKKTSHGSVWSGAYRRESLCFHLQLLISLPLAFLVGWYILWQPSWSDTAAFGALKRKLWLSSTSTFQHKSCPE